MGGLLHDVGKVIYRQGDRRKHGISGYDFLKEEIGLKEKDILESVKYHHSAELKDVDVEKDSIAYITYIADNIAAAADRRKGLEEEKGFEATLPLQPVFNVLNGNEGKYYYHSGRLEKKINYPTIEKQKFDKTFYTEIKQYLIENLKGIEWNAEYINSLLEVLEANLTYVPSSTARNELADISLYDHVKLTAALNCCIYDYLKEKQMDDYKETLYKKASAFYAQEAFLIKNQI